MATRILEYADKPEATLGAYPIVPARFKTAEQSAMTATGTSAQSSAFQSNTRIVIIQSDEDISVAFGSNPTATANSYRVYAKVDAPFEVAHGESWKVAIKT